MTSTSPFRRSALVLGLAATGALALGAAIAGPQEHVRIRHMDGGMPGAHFAALDADGDGAITRQEFEATRGEHIDAMDTNRDGLVSFAEHQAARDARAEQAFVERLDQDGDDRVSVAELSAGAEKHFDRMDDNDDGVLTEDEMGPGKRFHRGPRSGE